MALELKSNEIMESSAANFAAVPNDTHPIVEEMQFAYLRQLGRKERFERGLQRVDEGLLLMRRSFRQAHSDCSKQQLQIEWVRAQHGEELAARVENWLRNRTSR